MSQPSRNLFDTNGSTSRDKSLEALISEESDDDNPDQTEIAPLEESVEDIIFGEDTQEDWNDLDFLKAILDQTRFDLSEMSGIRYVATRTYTPVQKQMSLVYRYKHSTECRLLFHMSRQCVDEIIAMISNHSVFVSTGVMPQIPAWIQILIFLRYLAKGYDYDTIANDFGVGHGTVPLCIKRVLIAFKDYFGNAPYWPNEEKSISAQAVADSENRILFWYVGPPGAVHDSRAYRQTPLYHKSNDYFSEGEFLIGDSGYSVNRHLITPFSRRGGYSPTDAEAKYNKFISQKRIEVERTFGKLQQRFNIMEEFPCRIRGRPAQMARDMLWICDLSMIIINLHNYLLDSQDSFEFAAPDIYEEERARRRGWRRRYGRRETQGPPENLSTTEDATRLFEGNEVRRYIINMVPQLMAEEKLSNSFQ
ncbi:hypothetical protein TRICI_006412 [Trichomonascus ciferrii]|uniref:DDE Tnp4 domain-containing protein n=1 Tax=Trichomonascus ciferrii TaxID=44093 RepID=A0A642UHC5_9ASCO|nr:hypothetical protein TRICI_006412 [Trichomonascus ciferrii]